MENDLHGTGEKRPIFFYTASLALFWVIFIWGFFDKGTDALGFNATIFWLLFALLFRHAFRLKNIFWTIPFLFIAASFAIYENPWLKTINVFLLPIVFAFSVNYIVLENRVGFSWNWGFLKAMFHRVASFAAKLKHAIDIFFHFLFLSDARVRRIAIKSIIGLFIFIVISLSLIIPMLSSADPVFDETMRNIYTVFSKYLSFDSFWRVITWCVLSIMLIACFAAWSSQFIMEHKTSQFRMDAIISGIVLGGVLLLYLVFILTQIRHFWLDTLPIDFKTTESLVKSGFWQLFILSVINVVFFFLYYRTTHPVVQKILAVFTLASLLLLLSAGQRMFLYVRFYGLSYEKFFASYTVLYAGLLFIALIIFLFRKEKANIFKFLVASFLWMFSIATVLPIEQIIFRSNGALSKLPDSRIDMYELKMLSNDVLSLFENRYNYDPTGNEGWREWIIKQHERIASKKWYEKNIVNLIVNPLE